MAYATNQLDINRSTTITLPPEVSAEIFAAAEGQSAIMQLAERIDVPGRGLSIPVVTGDPVAQVVAETAEKPVSNSTLTTKLMRPLKFAAIELFSNEFRRDAAGLYDALIRRLPGSIAKAFDAQVLTVAAVSGFDSLNGAATVTAGATVSADVTAMIQAIGANGYAVNGFAVSNAYYAKMLTALDGVGRPLFIPGNDIQGSAVGSVFGAKVAKTDANILAIAGDFSQAKYGIVDGINIAYSEDATINDGTQQINLFQRNMFAVRVEAELGFVYGDADAFVKLVQE